VNRERFQHFDRAACAATATKVDGIGRQPSGKSRAFSALRPGGLRRDRYQSRWHWASAVGSVMMKWTVKYSLARPASLSGRCVAFSQAPTEIAAKNTKSHKKEKGSEAPFCVFLRFLRQYSGKIAELRFSLLQTAKLKGYKDVGKDKP